MKKITILHRVATYGVKNFALQDKAGRKVKEARKLGKMPSAKPCVCCGAHRGQGHHFDYRHALLVVWLCRGCHAKVHALLAWENAPEAMTNASGEWNEAIRSAVLDWRRDAEVAGRISTDAQLAVMACIHPTTLSALLNGTREWSMVDYLKIAAAIGLSAHQAAVEIASRTKEGEAGP